jgi:hypothetical protein
MPVYFVRVDRMILCEKCRTTPRNLNGFGKARFAIGASQPAGRNPSFHENGRTSMSATLTANSAIAVGICTLI